MSRLYSRAATLSQFQSDSHHKRFQILDGLGPAGSRGRTSVPSIVSPAMLCGHSNEFVSELVAQREFDGLLDYCHYVPK